jgi:hypothetical protein
MRIGTQRALSFTVTGTGGVYLVVAGGVVRPPVCRFLGAIRRLQCRGMREVHTGASVGRLLV